jgi:hypothetical protein
MKRRSLKEANAKLAEENRKINLTLESTISSLQAQISTTLTNAIQEKTELEKKLAVAEAKIQELTKRETINGCGLDESPLSYRRNDDASDLVLLETPFQSCEPRSMVQSASESSQKKRH